MRLASGCGCPGHAGGLAAPMNSLRISVRNWLTSKPPEPVRFFGPVLLLSLGLGLVFCFGFAFVFVFAFFLAMRLISPYGFDGPGRRQSLVRLQTEWMRTDASHQRLQTRKART